MDGKRRTVTSKADCSTCTSTVSVKVVLKRKTLLQLRRRAAG